jgi:dTMP kinase
MRTTQGKLIVLEGTDGTGKATQLALLKARLEKEGVSFRSDAFPHHGDPSAAAVDLYLSQGIAPADAFGPYCASVYYAVDRSFRKFMIAEWLREVDVVLLDRYVASNAGHQGGRIKNEKEREEFLSWLYDLEYNRLGIMRPDLNIILHLPAEVAQARKRSQKLSLGSAMLDAHEEDLAHLKAAEESYLWLARKNPDEYVVVSEMEGTRELTPGEVYEKVWKVLQRHIVERNAYHETIS